MNNKKRIIAGALIVGLGVTAWTQLPIAKIAHLAESTFESKEEMEREREEWKRAHEFKMKRLANPLTGEINPQHVYAARQQADALKLNKGIGQMNWEFAGPDNVGGRTRCLLVDKNNSNHLIAAGVSGGLFISNNAGNEWAEFAGNSDFPSQAITSIVQAANGDIYLGTGESFAGDFSGWGGTGGGDGSGVGEGIYKSTDGGNTFTQLPSTKPTDSNNPILPWALINAIATHPTDANTLYAAIGSNSSTSAATLSGLMVSTDGGSTWSVPTGIPTKTFKGMDVKVATDGTVHAVIDDKYYYKKPDEETFNLNTGTGFGQVPAGGGRRMIAVSPTDPNYVYIVIVTSSGGCLDLVLQSSDGGASFAKIGEGIPDIFDPMSVGAGCQGNYDLALIVDPANKERIFLGGVEGYSWSKTDGWNQISYWANEDPPGQASYVHADKHGFVFDPNNPKRLYVLSDGGISRTNNADATFPTFATINENYNVTQFYGLGAGLDGKIIGGTQDNGTRYVNYKNNSYLFSKEALGGDGGYGEISKTNGNFLFGGIYGGQFFRSTNGGEGFNTFFDGVSDNDGDGALDGGAEFIGPFTLWEDYSQIGQGAAKSLYVTGGSDGQVWAVSNVLDPSTSPNWTKIAKMTGGGVGCVAISNDGTVIYTGNGTGKIMRVSNVQQENGQILTSGVVKKQLSLPVSAYVTSVTPSPHNNDVVVVTIGGYGLNNNVYITTNMSSATPTFTAIKGTGADALPDMPVYDAAIDRDNENIILVATEMGVWRCDVVNGEYKWSEQNDIIGRIPVYEIREEIMKTTDCYVTYIATHGKGIYRSTALTPQGCDTSLPDYTGYQSTQTVPNQLTLAIVPNPITNNLAKLNFTLSQNAKTATVTVFDMQGRAVILRSIGAQAAGNHTIDLPCNTLKSGAYIAVLTADNQKVSKKMIIK